LSRVDLHVHSTFSDGTLTPRELVAAAKESGLAALALCDHDTVEGLGPFAAAGQEMGFPVIDGVELSLQYEGITHLLGLRVSAAGGAPARLDELQAWRQERNLKLLGRLADLGVQLDWGRLQEIARGGQLGRPHFARAMMELGVVGSLQEAFDKYMGKNRPAYVEKVRLAPKEAIRVLRSKGFAPVLAHPVSLGLAAGRWREILPEWVDWGLAGLEAWHPDHDEDFTSFVLKLARDHGLVATAGSDFHGANKPTPITWVMGHSPLGLDVVDRLREKMGSF
jgi:predicted metal-dependent phosphoesterase TrpH